MNTTHHGKKAARPTCLPRLGSMVLALLLAACTPTPEREIQSPAGAVQAAAPAGVGFAIIKTASRSVREGMLYAGGDFTKHAETAFSAVVIKHHESYLLFDTGLGSKVEEQYDEDMPWWRRFAFSYDDPVVPSRQQLDRAGITRVERVILSHAHWDHASGLGDFPEADVWVTAPELEFIHQAGSDAGKPWPSQVSSKQIRWRTLAFSDGPYEGFERSLDLFHDRKVVLVPMFGHTPGSAGMFVTVDSGRRYFFCGDVVWSAGALEEGKPKFWAARRLVDHDEAETQRTIELIRQAMRRDPKLVVVPAHDGTVQGKLGYFPGWIR